MSIVVYNENRRLKFDQNHDQAPLMYSFKWEEMETDRHKLGYLLVVTDEHRRVNWISGAVDHVD